jgi:hypothetical protein
VGTRPIHAAHNFIFSQNEFHLLPGSPSPAPSLSTFLALLTLALLRAYIDPGSGSFIIQSAIATVLGGALMVRLCFARIVGIFRRNSPDPDDADPAPDIEPD